MADPTITDVLHAIAEVRRDRRGTYPGRHAPAGHLAGGVMRVFRPGDTVFDLVLAIVAVASAIGFVITQVWP